MALTLSIFLPLSQGATYETGLHPVLRAAPDDTQPCSQTPV